MLLWPRKPAVWLSAVDGWLRGLVVVMLCLIQSGMITALISSCMVMSLVVASVFSMRKFSSPSEKMNLAMMVVSILLPSIIIHQI